MILTLILSALAGWAARPLEPRITEFLVSLIGADNLPASDDRRVAALLVTLLGAALVLWIGTSGSSPVVLVIGAALGYFQQELREAILSRQS